ncbi:Acg family FMN-binding oxidoreductase [Brevundimonas sp.]|uniref:Acg family FMN-binding oxidoreductase n=1 Tax=Brevundimonas sp. TaxID=1871086 RepID=UPI002B9A567D|nr:nitroreductase family protein [Brevundimonas sp.]HWQ86411.1 nitroreductase family protein [Brevundimonas sp.]
MNRRNLLLGAGALTLAAGSGAVGWRAAVGSAAGYDLYSARLRAAPPPDPALTDLVRYATLAANGHNTQPWKFHIGEEGIDILPDLARRTPVVDPDDHHLFVSLGCAAENLRIAATATGRPGALSIDGTGVRYVFERGLARADALFAAIPARRSTRTLYDGRPVPNHDLETLRRTTETPGVRLILLTDRPRIDRARDLVAAGNEAQMTDPAFMAELKRWLRFNPADAMRTGDGLYSASSGNPVLPGRLGGFAFDRFFGAAAETARYARQIDSSSGLAVFLAERADPAHWMTVGRACQRFMLAATALDLRCAFVNQPVEVAGLRPALAALVGEAGLRPDLVLRFGRGPVLPFSPRRPVSAVIL